MNEGGFESNSYNAGDAINCLKWADLEEKEYQAVFDYYKGLIAFRKAHGALRLGAASEVASAVTRVQGLDANVIAFDIKGGVNGETEEEIFVIFNSNEEATTVKLPDGNWNVYINGEKVGTTALQTIKKGSVTVGPISAMVLVKEDLVVSSGSNTALIIVIIAAVAVAGIAIVFSTRKKGGKKA